MKVFYNLNDWIQFRKSNLNNDFSLGFIPTMGALHEGHLSLMRNSLKQCERTVVSVFINPTQFNDSQDLKNYPIDIEEDLDKLESLGVDYVLVPQKEMLYPDGYRYKLTESEFSKKLCGKDRPGHFDGVLTVVMKLLQVVKPNKAYFGEKDYQQYLLVKEMAKAFFLDIEIVAGETVRESDGLAMSSRNLLLTQKQRETAADFHKILSKNKNTNKLKQELTQSGFEVDYVEQECSRKLAAVRLGKVRLIDNVKN